MLPVAVRPYGPFHELALQVHELTVQGRNSQALALADRVEAIAGLLGAERTAGMALQGRMYALISLGRLQEALATGERLLQWHRATGVRGGEARALADIAETLIKSGRLDEGLHRLANALRVLDRLPVGNPRYIAALSSISEAARAAELYELADSSAAYAMEAFDLDPAQHVSAELQRAEQLLEWGLRLEHVGLVEEAGGKFAKAAGLVRPWVEAEFADAPLANALHALALVTTGDVDGARRLAAGLIMSLRTGGHEHEARLAHLAHGIALRHHGDLPGARREFLAAAELAPLSSQRLIFQYELARLAAVAQPGEAATALLGAVQAQARHLWQLRQERRTMLQQARRRVELEAARERADRAAAQDALTGLGNRRQFDRHLDLVAEAGPGVLLLVDVDHFKHINDRYSHGTGDRVLRELAAVLRAHCRPDDVPVRLGGDEFALFLRCDLATAARVGARIRDVIAARDWNEVALGLRVTLSMGVAARTAGMTGRDLYDLADRHLYAAKRAGRDRVAAAA
ncbi:diguanylate cyclase [Dactylosporangium sp. NPDC051541]|uniref:diguanylate cyclase n=1 Tax=Dactylosporangium sp. NPDC051541 TaxID=3363977 RepID=UPI003788D79D